MRDLHQILEDMKTCSSCYLMAENEALNIQFVPILPKPQARVVFVGRDPSPRTARIVGLPGGKSVFINEVFSISHDAGLSDEDLYITDICKCHWRTSSGGKPLRGTEHRSSQLDTSVASTCLSQWLVPELQILRPELVVAFGAELYDLLATKIVAPSPPPREFSAKADKSVPDAEQWFAEHGTMALHLDGATYRLAVIRHPGSSSKLPSSTKADRRRDAYEKSRATLIRVIIETISPGAVHHEDT